MKIYEVKFTFANEKTKKYELEGESRQQLINNILANDWYEVNGEDDIINLAQVTHISVIDKEEMNVRRRKSAQRASEIAKLF